MIRAFGCDDALLVRSPKRRTTLKTRFISGSQQLLRCDEEDHFAIELDVEDALISQFERAVGAFNMVALSDYAKGVLSDRVLQAVIERCRALDIPVVVDPKRRDFGAYAGATVIKPNRSELSAFVGMPCTTISDCERAAEAAMEETGSAILLTMSEAGMLLFRHDKEMLQLHATATEVFDVSGAGDTALAIFCAGVSSGMDMSEAAMLSNVGAGAVVRKLGTATLSIRELAASVTSVSIGAIASLEEAARQVELWKHEGFRVGFTNGCFDIVHAGHIALLQQARATCDRLVVGLNTDLSVTHLKGEARPIQSEHSRAVVLAALGSVDLVVLFGEETPLELISALRPTDLIKGADYTEKTVVGASIVKADGGRVHLIELVPGLSTTNAVNRIRHTVEAAGN
jgi:D-beta-D-heptose 7-phosphate kinase/D-beta-D-heptose 1-phosphate adenosyltransferase